MLFTLRIHRLVPLGFFLLLAPACALLAGDDDDDFAPVLYEGDEPGECTDGADNDQDGLFDCNDPGCEGSPDCAGDDDDDDTTAPDDDDTTAPDDDDTTVLDDDDSTVLDDDDTTVPDDDDSTVPDDDDSTVPDDDDSAGDDDDDTTPPPATHATLRGSIIRSVAPAASGDAIGTLFVAIYEGQPFTGSGVLVRRFEQSGADFSGSGAEYNYEVTGIPPRGTPYVVVAFLDDNLDADPSEPVPGDDDLIHGTPQSFPVQPMPTAQEFFFDMTLDAVLSH